MGWLARQDGYDPDAFDVPGEQSTNVPGALYKAGQWFLKQAAKPEAEAQADVRNVMGALAAPVMVPGQMMKPNPYPPGSEEAAFYDASKIAKAVDWAPEISLNMMGGGVAGTGEKAAGAVVGSGPVKQVTKLPSIPLENNPGFYRDRPFWSGAFDPLDGKIIETHPYQKAESADFHHSNYFSDKAVKAMGEGRGQFFWLDKDGNIQTAWREAGAKPEIVDAIRTQLGKKGDVTLGSGATDKKAAAALQATGGIRAYHSSPHDFDKFDLAKIGTGEGAQVYGHGLYFAENPAVSGQGGQYWQQFAHQHPEALGARYLQDRGFDRSKAIADAREYVALTDRLGSPATNPAEARALLKLLESGNPVGPRTYEVNINADPAHMLDWDKLLREQPHIQDVLADKMLADLPGKAGVRNIRRINEEIDEILGSKSGDILYRKFSTNPREASAFLGEAGIPGIKYLDQGSRPTTLLNTTNRSIATYTDQLATATGSERQALLDKIAQLKTYAAELEAKPTTSNYVIFDPNIIRIDKKYALPLAAAPAGIGALAAQDRYE
jgi:hypothetical protein